MRETPGEQNGWNPTEYVVDPRIANEIIVAEAPDESNGWRRLVLGGGNRRFSVIMVEWSVVER
jgi:hypothetical protein